MQASPHRIDTEPQQNQARLNRTLLAQIEQIPGPNRNRPAFIEQVTSLNKTKQALMDTDSS